MPIRPPTAPPERSPSFSRIAAAGVLAALLQALPAWATVTITDCASDPHCAVTNRQTVIDVPGDTVVIAGPITPLGGTATIRVSARAIVVDAAGSLAVTGKGRSIELNAATTALVNGALFSTNSNGKILVTAVDLLQVQGPVALRSGGDLRFTCTGLGCGLHITAAHFRANHLVLAAQGDVVWDQNTIETFSPHDLIEVNAKAGSIRHSGALALALLESGRLAAATSARTDAASQAAELCPGCSPTPTRTPTPPGGPTPTRTHTPTPSPTPTSPLQTATLPLGTPSGPAPTPTATPPCRNCVTGGSESTLFLRAGGDIDASGDKYVIANRIVLTAGLNIDVSHAEIRNDFGKCGEIVMTAVGQVNIQGATLVDDDCPKAADVSEINGREQLPHQGFNDIIGTPAVDD